MMSRMHRSRCGRALIAMIMVASLAQSGCASMMQASRNSSMDREIVGGDYRAAALLAESRLGLQPDEPVVFSPKNVLDHLDAAAAWQLANNPTRSIRQYDAAEQALKDVETENSALSGAKTLGAVFYNDSALDYVPSPGESILINVEKALDFWQLGDMANTRVELNRADDRTRRAVEHYSAEIAAAKADAEGRNVADASDAGVLGRVKSEFPEMSQWQPYKEFILPAATYLKALYLSRLGGDSSDLDSANTLYKRLGDIVGAHPVIDLERAESARGPVCPKHDCIWVLVEYGLGPTLDERRFDLPVPTSSGFVAVSLALPHLVTRTHSDRVPFAIAYDDNRLDPVVFSSMDRVVETEFSKRFPAIVTRAVVSATLKAVTQNEVNRKVDNPLVSLMVNLASAASTSADIRMWRSMPSRWALARVNRHKGAQMTLDANSGPITLDLPADGSALVYIKAPNGNFKPVTFVLKI
jgi:hypothetical protein